MNKNSSKYNREVFLMVYVAGHGCADSRQYFILNEKEIDKIFWPVEDQNRALLRKCSSRCKLFAIYDCCREDIVGTQEKIVKNQLRMISSFLSMMSPGS